MAKRNGKRDETADLLHRSASDERRLLKRERRAERALLEAREDLTAEEARLERARARVERRRAEVAAAEAQLRKRQAARAAGPPPVIETDKGPAAANGENTTAEATPAKDVANPDATPSGDGKEVANAVSIAAAMGVPNM